MQCDLCGSATAVDTYGVYPPDVTMGEVQGTMTGWQQDITYRWDFSPAGFQTKNYCDSCIDQARKKSVRRAVFVFFLPTAGLGRLVKFSRCSKQEMGDLMAASEIAQHRDPRSKHIIWPLGSETGQVPSMEHYLTREKAAKRLAKKGQTLT